MKIGHLDVQAPLRPRGGGLLGPCAAAHTATLGGLVLWGLFSGGKLKTSVPPAHCLPPAPLGPGNPSNPAEPLDPLSPLNWRFSMGGLGLGIPAGPGSPLSPAREGGGDHRKSLVRGSLDTGSGRADLSSQFLPQRPPRQASFSAPFPAPGSPTSHLHACPLL